MKIVTKDYKNIINVDAVDDISTVKCGVGYEVWATKINSENEYYIPLMSGTESECTDLIKSLVNAIQNDEKVYII